MRPPGAADGPPPQQGEAIAAPPRREHVAKQVSYLESRWCPRDRQPHHKHVMPMKIRGAADGPPPRRERPSDAPPRREITAK